MDVHNHRWLPYSKGTSPEGRALQTVCAKLGFVEKVQKPTRGEHLLDLFLTDIQTGIRCKVLAQISDHRLVYSRVALKVVQSAPVVRYFWVYSRANWHGLQQLLLK